MLRHRLTLFHLLGFAVRVDASWLLLAIFITWSLARGFFPYYVPGHEPAAYWGMAAVAALGLFVSIILHEFSHSLVARRFGLPIEGITLFIFGGVAEMADEPPSPKSEFLMAVAGPLASLGVAAVAYVAHALLVPAQQMPAASGVLFYLAVINLVLAVFNLFPAFPLDGGRMLRATLWHLKGNLRTATRIAARVGRLFGFWLIALGILSALTGNLLGGVWWFLIGLFIMQGAAGSYQQVLLRQVLRGERVRRFMTTEPTAVPQEITVERFVADYVYRHYYKFYPVLDGTRAVGCIHTAQVKALPREAWERTTVGEVMQPIGDDNSIGADADAMDALAKMHRTGASRLMVLDPREHLAGLIALKDLLQFFQLKVDLQPQVDDDRPDRTGKRWFER